jgi:hypothetical protein
MNQPQANMPQGQACPMDQLSAPSALNLQRRQNIVTAQGVSQPNFGYAAGQQFQGEAVPAGAQVAPQGQMQQAPAQSNWQSQGNLQSSRQSSENPINLRDSANKDRPDTAANQQYDNQASAFENPAAATPQAQAEAGAQPAAEQIAPSGGTYENLPLENQPAQGQPAAAVQAGQRATLIMPAMQGMNSVPVNLIQEGGMWKLNVPNTLTADTLHNSLLNQINWLNQNMASLPNDATQAQRVVAQHVLMAIYQPQ